MRYKTKLSICVDLRCYLIITASFVKACQTLNYVGHIRWHADIWVGSFTWNSNRTGEDFTKPSNTTQIPNTTLNFSSWLTTSTDSDTHSPSPSLWGKAKFLIRLLEWKQSSCQPALSVPSHPVTAVSVLYICAGCRWKGLPGHRHRPESCSESSQTSRRTHNHTRDWSTDRRHIWPSDIKMWEQTSFVISQNSIFLCFQSVFCRGERKQDLRTEAIFLWCSRFEFLTWWNLVRTQKMIWFKGSVTVPCPSRTEWKNLIPVVFQTNKADLNMAYWTVKTQPKKHVNWSK